MSDDGHRGRQDRPITGPCLRIDDNGALEPEDDSYLCRKVASRLSDNNRVINWHKRPDGASTVSLSTSTVQQTLRDMSVRSRSHSIPFVLKDEKSL